MGDAYHRDLRQIEAVFDALWAGHGTYPRVETGRSLVVEQLLFLVKDAWGEDALRECVAAIEQAEQGGEG